MGQSDNAQVRYSAGQGWLGVARCRFGLRLRTVFVTWKANIMNRNRPYLSPLIEQELYDLWMGLKEKWPILYEKYENPDYDRPDYEEELRSVNGGIGFYVHECFPDVNFYPERVNILSDMINFHGRYMGKNCSGWKP